MSLILVTVVRDDLEGLIRTQASISKQTKTADWIVVSPDEPTSTNEHLGFMLQEEKLQRLIKDLGSGIYSAMNLAIHETNENDWLWFMNAGDEFARQDAISLVIDAIEKSKSNWIFGGHILGSENGKILGRHPAPPKFKRENQLFARKYVSHQSTIFRNSFLRELGGFDESYLIASDWDLMARASFTDSGYCLDSDLIIFSTRQRQKGNLELLQIRKKQLPLYYFVKNYLWFGYRFIRNSIVVKAEYYFPHFLDRIRSNRISLQRCIDRLFVRNP